MASVFLSSEVKVWTADLLALSVDGKALGLDSEIIVFGIVSEGIYSQCKLIDTHSQSMFNSPLFRAPQTWQARTLVGSPVDSGRRFPQSVQKIKEPIADMVIVW